MTREDIIRMAREAGFDSAHLTRFAELVFEQGRQEGMKQERALWELSKLGQEIEAQPVQDTRRLQIALRQWEDWKAYALELQKKLVKYEGGSPMILNTQPERPWVPLTDEERASFEAALPKTQEEWDKLFNGIEAKLKEKNA